MFSNWEVFHTSIFLVCWSANACSRPAPTSEERRNHTNIHKFNTMSEDCPIDRPFVSQTQDGDSSHASDDDDDDECSDFSSTEKPPPRKIPKLGGKVWWCLNIDSNGKSYYPASGSPANVKTALWELAGREFGGNPANGVYFLNGDSRSTIAHAIQGYRCAFYHQAGCKKPLYRVVFSKTNSTYRIETARTDEHTDHTKYLVTRGAPKAALVNSIQSPESLRKLPKQLLGVASRKAMESGKQVGTAKFTIAQQTAIKRRVTKLRNDFATRDLDNGGDGSAYGDVVERLLRKYSRKSIEQFGKDTVFLVNDEVHLETKDDGQVRFYCVLSTENLLLNAPRQQATGQEIVLAVDASYRYVVERDHGLFVVKTINHSQTAKVIAYAICNREDEPALTWIFKSIKVEVERIVNRLIAEGVEWM